MTYPNSKVNQTLFFFKKSDDLENHGINNSLKVWNYYSLGVFYYFLTAVTSYKGIILFTECQFPIDNSEIVDYKMVSCEIF